MPNVFGEDVSSVSQIVSAFRRHGDAVRGTYRARYVFDERTVDPYAGTTLERPPALVGNAPGTLYPWEQVFMAAAACAGSDYPMLAAHAGVPLERVEFVVEGLYDPRGEFDGLEGFTAPADARHCYLKLHLRAMLRSSAPREVLEAVHRRVLEHNMVLGALRGVPRTDELRIESAGSAAPAGSTRVAT